MEGFTSAYQMAQSLVSGQPATAALAGVGRRRTTTLYGGAVHLQDASTDTSDDGITLLEQYVWRAACSPARPG